METISRNGWHDAPNLQEEKRKKNGVKNRLRTKNVFISISFLFKYTCKYVLSFLVNYLLKLKLRSIQSNLLKKEGPCLPFTQTTRSNLEYKHKTIKSDVVRERSAASCIHISITD